MVELLVKQPLVKEYKMGLKFSESAFNQGATVARELLRDKREEEAALLAANNKAQTDANNAMRNAGVALGNTIDSLQKQKIAIKTNEKLTVEDKAKGLNGINKSIKGKVTVAATQAEDMNNRYGTSYNLGTDGGDTQDYIVYTGKKGKYLEQDITNEFGESLNDNMKVEMPDGTLHRSSIDQETNEPTGKSDGTVIGHLAGAVDKPTDGQNNIDVNSLFPTENLSKAEKAKYKKLGYSPTVADVKSDRKTSGSGDKKRTIGDIKVAEHDKYVKNGGTETFEAWETRIQETAKTMTQAKIITNTISMGKNLNSDNYNADDALTQESLFTTTPANNSKIIARADAFEKAVVLEKTTNKLYDEFKRAVDSGEYQSGLLQTSKLKIAEYTGEGKFTELIGLSGEEMATRLGIDTKMGDAVAKYVKLISGAAATDAERQTLMNIMFGSDFKDEKVRLEKFDAFREKMKTDNTAEANSLKKFRPYTAGEYLGYGKKKNSNFSFGKDSLRKRARENRQKKSGVK